jgi:hypothetical protein
MALPNVFTSGDVFTAANANLLRSNQYNQTVSTKTANYVLVAGDVGTRVLMNAAGSTTITVNTSLFVAGDTLEIANIGAGVCTITSGTCTVTSSATLALAQYASGTLFFTSASAAIFIASAVTPSAGGLVYITQATPSAVNSVSINDCFSSTYQNYKIVINATTSVGVNSYLSMRYRLSGSDTITQYSYTELNTDGASVGTSASALGNTLQPIGYIDPTYKGMQYWIDLQDINQAVKTKCYILTSNASAAGAYTIRNIGGVQDATTQFTGITFTTSGTSFTGTIRVYGYANS